MKEWHFLTTNKLNQVIFEDISGTVAGNLFLPGHSEYFYAPYIPLQTIGVANAPGRATSVNLKTRYGQTFDVPMIPNPETLSFTFLESNNVISNIISKQITKQTENTEASEYKFNIFMGNKEDETGFFNKLSNNIGFQGLLEGCFITNYEVTELPSNSCITSFSISIDKFTYTNF